MLSDTLMTSQGIYKYLPMPWNDTIRECPSITHIMERTRIPLIAVIAPGGTLVSNNAFEFFITEKKSRNLTKMFPVKTTKIN